MDATLTFDSGLFLPANPGSVEIGFFQNKGRSPDIRVYADGEEARVPSSSKLAGDSRTIEVILRKTDGTVRRQPITKADTFLRQLTRLDDLYDSNIAIDRSRFDWILRLESGHLRGSSIKKRMFIEARRLGDGSFKPTGNSRQLTEICHNVVARFELGRGELFELTSDGKVLLSSRELGVRHHLLIEFPTEDSAGQKIYCQPLVVQRQVYWFPDGCDEGPSGPYPPCQTTGRFVSKPR